MTPRNRGWAQLAGDVLEDLIAVVASHLRLARQEVEDQGRDVLSATARVLAGALLLQVAVLFVAAALALLLGRLWDDPLLGLLAVGLSLGGGGLALLVSGRRRLRGMRVLGESWDELRESRRWLQQDLFPRLRRNARD